MDTVEDILFIAESKGKFLEVRDTASKIIEENPKIEQVEAYEIAFKKWVK